MIELTIEQHSSALADPQTPKRVLDPVSKEEIDVGRLIEDAMAEYDADDPLLVTYPTAKDQ